MRAALREVRPGRLAGLLGTLLVVAYSLTLDDVKLSILVGVVATAIAALGLDLLVARTGQLSVAHAAFLGVGAFTAINVGGRGAPWFAAVAAAVVVTAAAAALAGLPSLRIRGLQVAITTLAFQVAAEGFLFVRSDVTAGDRTLERPGFLGTDVRLYLLALAALALVLLLRRRIGGTVAGRSFLAVRDVEARAQCFGVDPGRNKLLAYALSGAIVGLGGAVLALKEGSIGTATDPFKLLESLQLVAIVVVGGASSAAGIVSAAVVVKYLPQVVTGATDVTPILSALMLVVVVVVFPAGIGGVYARLGRLVDRALGREAPRPDPRPQLVDLQDKAHHAVALRSVPRPLSLRMPVAALLVAQDVTVQYGGVTALSHVSLEVRRGEIVGLIGANGAGKSTFFNAVSGLAPVTGSIRYRGVELVGAKPTRRSALGAARTFQDMGLVRAETVRENVLLAQTWLARYGPVSGIVGLGSLGRERELRRRADLALDLFGLDHLADERLGDLPYGTMRIVEIASAVAAGPDVLMLDEATAGLGPDEAHALGDRFLVLREELGLTLVVIEHHVPLIARVCDWCYCLESGSLIAQGPPDVVTAEPEVVASFLGRSAAAAGGVRS